MRTLNSRHLFFKLKLYNKSLLLRGNTQKLRSHQKLFLLFAPYAKTHRPILVPHEYPPCVDGIAAKCIYGHTFNLLYRDWMVDKLANREPTPEETQILNQFLALQTHCNADLYPRELAACLAEDKDFLEFLRDPDNQAPDLEFEFPTLATVLPFRAHKLTKSSRLAVLKNSL